MYLKGWFIIDLISVFPLDLIMAYGYVNRIMRISRITKIYKMIRKTKMIRLAKFGKRSRNYSRISRASWSLLPGLIHIIACFSIYIAKFGEFSKDNWINSKGYQDDSVYDLNLASFHFSLTTFVTVGYVDITNISC